MARLISPPKDQLSLLRQPLTPGEVKVLEFFDHHLESGWEIYLQPHLNGLRPDVVLLHPHVGIAVFEVKDWDLQAIRRWLSDRPGRSPILLGERDGKTFSLQSQNPVEKVYLYKDEIRTLYCPRLEERASLAVVSAGVIFTEATTDAARALLVPSLRHWRMEDPQYYPVSGKDALTAGDLLTVFPEGLRGRSKFMTPELAADLRNWLVEPDVSETQRTPLILSKEQEHLATTRTETGYRRIKGPAGSGKSAVLAARAAELVEAGEEVLIITFNITLRNYLQDLAVRRSPRARRDATWLNFHDWCKRVCFEADLITEYKSLWREYFEREENPMPNEHIGFDSTFNQELCDLLAVALTAPGEAGIKLYDAVLVDEGQDFRLEWWDVLRRACAPGGEMLLVADTTQDVYGTAGAWTDQAMLGAGFRGDWSRLRLSYRLPSILVREARRFATEFLAPDLIDLPEDPQLDLELASCQLRWVQTDPEQTVDVCVREMMRLVTAADPDILPITDITFLCDREKIGQAVVAAIEAKGIRVAHTFASDRRAKRRRKVYFFMGAPMPKATTLHSFKGWESRAIVACVEYAARPRARALIYTGLTRLKRHSKGSYLTVVSAAPELDRYGRGWPDFLEAKATPMPVDTRLTM